MENLIARQAILKEKSLKIVTSPSHSPQQMVSFFQTADLDK
jgi:hypothetical protein